jgi:hypothetical protein
MAANLDLNLLPVARYAGREYPELLCLHVAQPPRRRARGRENDRLILYLAMIGNAPLPPGQQEEALADLAKLFYATPGSLTAALRRTAEELNKTLLDRNLHLSGSSRQGLGILAQAALREGERSAARSAPGLPGQVATLTLALSGPAQVYQLSSGGVEHFYDMEMAERALGQSKATPVTFFQANLHDSDTLLLAAQPALDWSVDALAGLHGQGPESLRRRLFGQPVTEVNAVLVQARPGKGTINLPRPGRPGITPAPASSPLPVKPIVTTPAVASAAPEHTLPVSAEAVEQPIDVARQPIDGLEQSAAPALPTAAMIFTAPPGLAEDGKPQPGKTAAPGAARMLETPLPGPGESVVTETPAPMSSPATSPPAESASPAARDGGRRLNLPPVGAGLRALVTALVAGFGALGRGIRWLLTRILPEEALSSIPSSVMAFTAVATPVVIVSIATLVYGRLGTSAQYDAVMNQAREIGRRGMEQTDLSARHTDLTAALDLLSQAEAFGQTNEIDSLRVELRQALDEMDLALRVDFSPAIVGGLPPGVQIQRIAANEDDLFILDGASGNVLHARLSGQGYELDRTYICGLSAGVPGIGAAKAIAAWPSGYLPEGNLLALDEKGGVLICKNGGAPEIDRLTRPEATDDWGQVAAFTLDEGGAYVLDLPSKGVWIYLRSEFKAEPSFFFNDEIPDVQDVVDLAANRDDLYLLHADGSLTLCSYSTFAGVPTRCSRPAYEDRRPGRENMPLVPPGPFTQIQNTLPPDPSLFLLEPKDQAIYHFSLRSLAFQRQYMPSKELASGPATAFFVDNIKRRLFLAAGGQVYYAVMP